MLQAVQPWLSSRDVLSGDPRSLADALASSQFGIVCLTEDNANSLWLNFEVGALSKGSGAVQLYGLGIRPVDVTGPLAGFQMVTADRDGTYRLVRVLNASSGERQLSEDVLGRAFELWWPVLRNALDEISGGVPIRPSPVPSMDDKVDELVHLVRQLVRDATPVGSQNAGVQGNLIAQLTERPRVFIGSSIEGLHIAQAIQEGLDSFGECTVWNQGAFGLGTTFIDSLQDARLAYDFAVIVLTPDDTVTSRGETSAAPRDNLIFELGLFAGALGRARTFLVMPRDDPPKLPSDLSGVTVATYRSRTDGNTVAALGPAVLQISRAMGVDGRQ